MAAKTFWGLSLRTGTLILLYIHLINCVWSAMYLMAIVNNPIYKEFLAENIPAYYMNLFFSIIGGIIYLGSIISIANKTPSNSLLSITIAFSIMSVIYSIYWMVHLNLCDNYLTKMAREAQSDLKKLHEIHIVEKHLQMLYLCNMIFELYSALVFQSYYAEAKKNVSPGKNNDEEANLSAPPPYSV
ncbi:uncharacterized protein LOC135834600 [Planococcus citri]|uniref:uncharacterized protein LOC135834600 n=1 Tax=Planococcus citri TaxID=170843 RepID=UPI0031FA03FA